MRARCRSSSRAPLRHRKPGFDISIALAPVKGSTMRIAIAGAASDMAQRERLARRAMTRSRRDDLLAFGLTTRVAACPSEDPRARSARENRRGGCDVRYVVPVIRRTV
jgi:hypothetical protein